MNNSKIGQVDSKSSVNKNMNAFLFFKPWGTFVQNSDIPIKNAVSPGISSEGARKALLVKIKNKMLLQNLKGTEATVTTFA